MKEQLNNIFSNEKLKEIIADTEAKYQFTSEEDITLKSILLSTYLLTREESSIYYYFHLIANNISKNHEKNNFDKIIEQIIDEIFKKAPNDFDLARVLIGNYILDGYYYHSFNSVFLNSIKEKGLLSKEKPWDDNEIEEIKAIFSSHNIKNIFGLYQGNKDYPIFLAESLNSSGFYANSSPTWFRHFASGGMSGTTEYDKNAFYNVYYEDAKENVIKMCKKANLNSNETMRVLLFFEKYWNMLATKDLPCIALVKRTDLKDTTFVPEPLDGEIARQYCKRAIFSCTQGNHIVRKNIPPEKIIIFPYELSLIKEINLERRHL